MILWYNMFHLPNLEDERRDTALYLPDTNTCLWHDVQGMLERHIEIFVQIFLRKCLGELILSYYTSTQYLHKRDLWTRLPCFISHLNKCWYEVGFPMITIKTENLDISRCFFLFVNSSQSTDHNLQQWNLFLWGETGQGPWQPNSQSWNKVWWH